MPFTPNKDPIYPIGPQARMVANVAAAKTVFTDATNTSVLVDRTAAADTLNNRFQIGLIFARPHANIVQGKLQLYLTDGTNFRLVDEVAHAAQAGITTTAAGTRINFPDWSPSSPLVVPDGWGLLVASTVAQTAGVIQFHAQQITVL